MRLTQLLRGIYFNTVEVDPPIRGLCQDSRKLRPGDLFFAYPGEQADGRDFITEAIAKGAAAILFESKGQNELPPSAIPLLAVENVTSYLSLIAARFYDYPSHNMPVIGITGTNGKTSCVHFLAQSLQRLNYPCGVIGTLGNGLYGRLKSGLLTTPDAIELQQLLAEFRAQNARAALMEVSSHRLAQQRLNGMEFFIAAFTNLTRDHLDYHGTMAAYAQAKRSFFNLPGIQQAVLNADDRYARVWLKELNDRLPCIAYSIAKLPASLAHIPHVAVKNYVLKRSGLQAEISTPWGDCLLENPFLIGKFNLSNVLVTFILLKLLGFSLAEIGKVLAELKGVKGRMETFVASGRPLVIIDYAHTPDALKQVLTAIRAYNIGTLYCVFGCGGNRDKGKRALMAKVAEQYADQLVLTSDNPRFEDPLQIIKEMQRGLSGVKPSHIEPDRRLAIAFAVKNAKAEDTILVAGKGHETYQLISGIKHPFSDVLEVSHLLNLDTR
jgi:UDP-N-acetylmuramoyl-L-alanyl-D-glutamate--2,6-diaminopimelate ligase